MSADRVTVHASIVPGRYSVRYGNPGRFDHLGYVLKRANRWWIEDSDGGMLSPYDFATRKEAVSALIEKARL